MDPDFVERLVGYLAVGGTVLTVALIVRLIATGLWRRYPWFVGYLVALSAESGLLAAIHGKPVEEQQAAWLATRVVTVSLELRAVLEIFSQWTVSFPGIGAFGRKLFVFVLLIATAVATLTLPLAWPPDAWSQLLKTVVLSNRGAVIGFALFLILTVGFFWKFGGPVPANLRRHTWAMTAYVTATAVSYFVLSLVSREWVGYGNALMTTVTLASLAYWTVALSPAGEALRTETPRNEAEWADAEEMNRQMQKLADSITLAPRGVKKER